jgi:5-amino-6-(5-phosphoribosylamino)uracil reductase
VRRLFPLPGADLPIEDVYSILDWQAAPARPFVALNMVASVDGRVALEGSARGIGSTVDRALMLALRANADAVMFGAGTLRAEGVGKGVPADRVPYRLTRGLAPQPLLVVLTASGRLPLERSFFADPDRAIVCVARSTPREAVERLEARTTVRIAGDERPDPAEVLRILGVEFGIRHVLCEGGPELSHSLLAAGLLDELYFTLAPRLLGGEERSLLAGAPFVPPIGLALLSVHEHEGELFLRYAVDRQAPVEGSADT